MTLKPTSYLTKTEADRLVEHSHAGQAHFGGTGPAGAHCASCFFFEARRAGKRRIFKKDAEGRCRKFTDLTRRRGPTFPAAAAACRHFVVRS